MCIARLLIMQWKVCQGHKIAIIIATAHNNHKLLQVTTPLYLTDGLYAYKGYYFAQQFGSGLHPCV
jgi:hypothetical protein